MKEKAKEAIQYVISQLSGYHGDIIDDYVTLLEEQNKELQENIGLTMNLSESILQELKSERGIKEYLIKSFKEQIQGLQSLLDLKQQEISVLESKVGEHRRCFECKDKHDCYSFSTLTEDQSYFMCCYKFEPKNKS